MLNMWLDGLDGLDNACSSSGAVALDTSVR